MKLFARHDLKDVGKDEPVFLIRASDAEGPNLLRKYAFLLRARHPELGPLAGEIEDFAGTMFEWQHAEGNVAPLPSPEEAEPESPGPGSEPEPPPADPGPSPAPPSGTTPAVPGKGRAERPNPGLREDGKP